MWIKTVVSACLGVLLMLSCGRAYSPRTLRHVALETFAVDSTDIRALTLHKDNTLWYAGSAGAYGTLRNGILKQYRITDSSNGSGTAYPHFRAIAPTDTAVFALSIGTPALLFRIDATPPNVHYREDHPKVFYDAMAFFDTKNGIAFGDPTAPCLSVLLTKNGGTTWDKLDCSALPRVEEGEGAFAASNTNIAIAGAHAWLVTGGKRARVFHTPDKGKSWKVYTTPIVQGKPTTGIYSAAFYNKKHGISMGGDYTDKAGNTANKAVTVDGGKTWTLVANGEAPGYISCVQYVPGTKGKELFAVSTEGIYFSNDRGHHWTQVSAKGFYTLRVSDRHTAWLGGRNTVAKMTF